MRTAGKIAGRLGLLGVWVVYLLPLYLLVAVSLKTPAQTADHPFRPPFPGEWGNYREAVQASSGSGTASFTQALINSVIITGASVTLLIILGAAAGYYLGRRTSRLSTGLYYGCVAAIVVPMQLVIIPVYQGFDRMGLTGTRIGVIMLYVGFLMPFTVFLITGFVRALPTVFEEAAMIDGCGHLRMFRSIVLPLLWPIISTVAVLDSIAVWNDFFGQLFLLSGSGKETLPITVFSFAGQHTTRYDLLSAGLVLTIVPVLVLYLALQRRVIEGFSTGVKG